MHILRWEVIRKHTTWHSPGTLLYLPVIAPRLQTKVSFFLGGEEDPYKLSRPKPIVINGVFMGPLKMAL